ncbi:MAG TPA: alpha/beta hydrolase [Actinomycetes bacterium]|nr:alpha/beta hydrolase [Actinomycetes bacterium]
MNPTGRAGVASATVVAAAIGAAAGFAAERVVVGRPLRRAAAVGRLGLGQLRGPHQIVTADDGVQLYVEVDEPRRGAPWEDLTVVFVHGYALNMDSYHYQRQALRGSARLVFYDQRSHGRSGRGDRSRATIHQLASDLNRVVSEVAPSGPVVLVGHSMGGMTIMGLAEHSPELFGSRIVGVGFLSTSAGGMTEVTHGLPSLASEAFRRITPGLLAVGRRSSSLIERGRRMSNDLAVMVTRVYAFSSDVPVELVDFSLEMINATPIEVLADFYPALQDHHAFSALGALDGVETLVLVGEQDLVTPSDHSRAMVNVLPGVELVVLDPGGHLIMLERPDDVNSHLFDLLERAARVS